MKRYITIGLIALSLLIVGCNDDKDKQANTGSGTGTVTAVPEPSTLILTAIGLSGLILLCKRKTNDCRPDT